MTFVNRAMGILLGLLVVELTMAWKFRAGAVALGVLLVAGTLGVGGAGAGGVVGVPLVELVA